MRDKRPNNRTLKLELLSQWKLEAESRNKAFLQHHIVYTGQSHAVKIYLSEFKFAVSGKNSGNICVTCLQSQADMEDSRLLYSSRKFVSIPFR